MLGHLKKQWRSLTVALVCIVAAAFVVWLSDAFQQCMNKSYYESSDHEPEKGIAQILPTLGWTKTCTGQFLKEDGEAITAFFTLVVGAFTAALWFSTDKLWRSSESQIQTSRQIAAIQARQTRVSNREAIKATEHLSRVERAYLFLALEVESRIVAFQQELKDTKSFVKFGFKNHGKTPAIIEELHIMAGFWGASWPAMETAERMIIQKGWAVSAGEIQGGYSTEFSLTLDEITRARNKKGYILFWGKVIYRDVFKDTHESGWCRAYHFPSEGWLFAGDQTLNYYT